MKVSSAAKRVFLIFILFLICLFISLPNRIPLKIDFQNIHFEKEIVRPNLDLKIGKFELKKNFDLVLGLDLAGGSHLVFEADLSNIESGRKGEAIDSLKNVIEKRVNLYGVSEPSIQTSSFDGKERIVVELPGVKDTKEAISLIGQTAQLSFWEYVGSSESAQPVQTDLTGADLISAKVVFDQNKTGKPAVTLKFSDQGGQKFAKITERNIGKPVPIVLDENLVSSPTVQEVIADGNAVISGDFGLEEAKNLAIQLNAGALPVPVKLVEERTVGATLGADSINKSIKAGLVGLSMVLIFMILAYGGLGLVADLGLIVFGVITLALYKLIPVTLTLPGIAGFLLSVGMAVDSNILIFERFKEERLRRPIPDALEVSFGRAWDSIRDANIATLVTAFILANPFGWNFLHTSGPVRGFAITLALGIAISLFTGVVVSRNLLRLLVREKKEEKKK